MCNQNNHLTRLSAVNEFLLPTPQTHTHASSSSAEVFSQHALLLAASVSCTITLLSVRRFYSDFLPVPSWGSCCEYEQVAAVEETQPVQETQEIRFSSVRYVFLPTLPVTALSVCLSLSHTRRHSHAERRATNLILFASFLISSSVGTPCSCIWLQFPGGKIVREKFGTRSVVPISEVFPKAGLLWLCAVQPSDKSHLNRQLVGQISKH